MIRRPLIPNIIRFGLIPRIPYRLVEANTDWEDGFVVYDELLPIPKLIYGPNNTDPLSLGNYTNAGRTLVNVIDPLNKCWNVKRSYTEHTRRLKEFTFFNGYLSVVGNRNIQYENAKISNDNAGWTIRADYDIFMLAVLKKPYRYQYEITQDKYGSTKNLSIRKDNIIILINREKLYKNDSFVRAYYTSTFRKYVMQFFNDQVIPNFEYRIVSDEYMNKFIGGGVNLKTNSFTEIHNIQSEIVESVFTNLKPELII